MHGTWKFLVEIVPFNQTGSCCPPKHFYYYWFVDGHVDDDGSAAAADDGGGGGGYDDGECNLIEMITWMLLSNASFLLLLNMSDALDKRNITAKSQLAYIVLLCPRQGGVPWNKINIRFGWTRWKYLDGGN